MLDGFASAARASAVRAANVSPELSSFWISRFDWPRRIEDENVRMIVTKTRNACMGRPPPLVNHSIMTTRSLVIVVRTKHEVQRYGCKNGHWGCNKRAQPRRAGGSGREGWSKAPASHPARQNLTEAAQACAARDSVVTS